MAATFNKSLTGARDLARQRLGDTDVNDALFEDETYDALLQPSGASPLLVAAQLARDLAARYARKVNSEMDDQKKSYSDLMKHYAALAVQLDADAAAAAQQQAGTDRGDAIAELGGGVMVGGTSAREVYEARCDPDHPDNVRRW